MILERFEPGDEGLRVLRDRVDEVGDVAPEGFYELAFHALHPPFLVDRLAPGLDGRLRRKPVMVPVRQALVQGLGVWKLRTKGAEARKTFATKHGCSPGEWGSVRLRLAHDHLLPVLT
ncbi:hypothetical protein [Caulobacter sp. FWC2]|uniref:hypothetical protein n=1 Tax=Caulobacter sp. FWC2 TaxID=69664 RepID=UPI001E4A5875|nr:hypothetical protein [Caulobacter sp. FWC2]